MPTFTAIALESLLESSARKSSTNASIHLKQEKNKNKIETSNGDGSVVKKPPKHIYISPALYTTPEPGPIPDTPLGSVSPSPYVVNHKRRDIRVSNAANRLDGFEIPPEREEERVLDGLAKDGGNNLMVSLGESSATAPVVDLQEENDEITPDEEIVDGKGKMLVEEVALEKDENPDDFFDPRESMSVISCSETDDLPGGNTLVANPSDFYDADEEFLSDCSLSSPLSFGPSFDVETSSTRLKLIAEIDKRKKAEDALVQMRNLWRGISTQFAQVGLSFPTNLDITDNTQTGVDSVEQLCQEITVARFVSEAIGRGQARAESEAIAESIIESKNQEIFRLRDRVQYYEAVNLEMSHRNQEVMEIARRQRQQRKTRRRWMWGFLGLSVTIGASALAYSYLQHTDKPLMVDPSDSDASSSATPERS